MATATLTVASRIPREVAETFPSTLQYNFYRNSDRMRVAVFTFCALIEATERSLMDSVVHEVT
jgi:hypothetical protein